MFVFCSFTYVYESARYEKGHFRFAHSVKLLKYGTKEREKKNEIEQKIDREELSLHRARH